MSSSRCQSIVLIVLCASCGVHRGGADSPDAVLDTDDEVGADGSGDADIDNPVHPYCHNDSHCPPDEFCEFPAGSCFAPGACAHRTGEPCDDAPVCSCGHVTFSSACECREAGASVLHVGACETTSCAEGEPEGDCEEGEFCEGPESPRCDATGRVGWCEPVPETCPRIADEVCACDGNVYTNDCERKKSGRWRAHFGAFGYCWGL